MPNIVDIAKRERKLIVSNKNKYLHYFTTHMPDKITGDDWYDIFLGTTIYNENINSQFSFLYKQTRIVYISIYGVNGYEIDFNLKEKIINIIEKNISLFKKLTIHPFTLAYRRIKVENNNVIGLWFDTPLVVKLEDLCEEIGNIVEIIRTVLLN